MFFKRFDNIFIRSQRFYLNSLRTKSYFVTTPIFYVNSSPHIGHLYTATLADSCKRWNNLRNGTRDAKLVTGTDEHGLKIFQAAQKSSIPTKKFCNSISKRFKDLFDDYQISYDDFIRTTEDRHQKTVYEIWNRLDRNGFIYKDSYEGWYCTSDETFISNFQVEKKVDPITNHEYHINKDTGNRLEWIKEMNYMFKLSYFIPLIEKWLTENPEVIYPVAHQETVLEMLKNTEDLSISRSSTRVPWGIPVPGDDSQVIYVWIDALSNYLTASGFPDGSYKSIWPPDVQFIGIDILKFHTVYWPAILLACGLELPKNIVVHSHWTYDGYKMSKSKGNVVDPLVAKDAFTFHGFKYFLLRQSVLEHNCSYTDQLVLDVINGDLSNDLGNCLNRVLSKGLNPDNTYPTFYKRVFEEFEGPLGFSPEDKQFVKEVKKLPKIVDKFSKSFQYKSALNEIMNIVRKTNQLVHRNLLWQLHKTNEEEMLSLQTKLYCVFEALRVTGVLLQPFNHQISQHLLDKISIPVDKRRWEDIENNFQVIDGITDLNCGRKIIKDKSVLFKTILSDKKKPNQKRKSPKKTAKDVI